MERDDIIGGLISALSRGEQLNSAMMTFINAGYKRETVEDAARSLNIPSAQQGLQQPQVQTFQQPQQQTSQPKQLQQPQQFQPQQPQYPQNFQQPRQTMNVVPKHSTASPGNMQKQHPLQVQIVSNYEKPRSRLGLVVVIVLGFILLALIGILIGVIFFRDSIERVLSGLLGNG